MMVAIRYSFPAKAMFRLVIVSYANRTKPVTNRRPGDRLRTKLKKAHKKGRLAKGVRRPGRLVAGYRFFSSFFFIWYSFERYRTASESSQTITPYTRPVSSSVKNCEKMLPPE